MKSILIIFKLFIVLSIFPVNRATSAVWLQHKEWSPHDEVTYALWVKEKFTPDIFWKSGAYPNVSTDCADSVYAMRLIFSYEHNLPFVIRQPDSQGGWLSNQTKMFDRIKDPRQRFMAFLEYVMAITSSLSLADDTYPVEITREALTPGSIYLATGTHSFQVIDITDGGITIIQYSTVPRTVRVMSRLEMFPNYVPGDLKIKNGLYQDGFRRFKQPQMYSLPNSKLPYYSLEQFEKSHEYNGNSLSFYEWVQSRLAIRPETLHEKLQRSLLLICYSAWERAEVVNEGLFAFRIKQIKNRQNYCFNSAEYDEYSTPIRDKRLFSYFSYLNRLPETSGYVEYQGEMKDMIDQITGRMRTEKMESRVLEWCDINKQSGGPGRPMSLSELHDIVMAGKLISDPHANRLQRWGLESFAPFCKQY